MRFPRPPFLFLLAFALAFLGFVGHGWLGQAAGARELLLPLAKLHDWESACRASGGIAWWTPSYMHGVSLAPMWQTAMQVLYFEGGRFLLAPLGIGPTEAYKLLSLGLALLAALMLYGFAAELTGCATTAALAGAFYLLCPEMAIRLAEAEHLGTVACFPFAPLLLWLVLRVAKSPGKDGGWPAVLALALGTSAMLLTSTKVALLFMPIVALFAAWAAFAFPATREERLAFALRLGRAALVALPLALLPLLPLLREQRWMTFFSHDPFTVWQDGFTLKSVLSLWDRGGLLLADAPEGLHTSADAFYSGILWVSGIAAMLAAKRDWLRTREGGLFRLFVGGALLLGTLSYGVRSPLGAHRQLLSHSAEMANWSIPLLWLVLLAQAALVILLASFAFTSLTSSQRERLTTSSFIWLLLFPILLIFSLFRSADQERDPDWLWKRRLILVGLAFFWLVVPLFPLVEHLPGFGQIRAPASFWNMGGSFCIALAGALAWRQGFTGLRPGTRLALLAPFLLVATTLTDFSTYHAAFFRDGFPAGEGKPKAEAVLADYGKAAAFLRDHAETEPGTALVFSGRYFYLELPAQTGRPLHTEAAMSYLQPEWSRALADAGRETPEAYAAALAAAGVSHVVLDKTDPDLPAPFADQLRKLFPAVLENPNFAVLAVPGAGAPALALPVRRTRLVAPGTASPAQSLALYGKGRWTIEPALDSNEDIALPQQNDNDQDHSPLPSSQRLPLLAPHRANLNPETIRLAPAPYDAAWVVVPENWHPDWKAFDEAGHPLPVCKALGAYLAAPVPHPGAAVTFRFEAPFWYGLCLGLSLLAWLATAGLLGFLLFFSRKA
ncbi:hypothetical protein SAMN05444156_1466 [Verrucomicrobium sp. GAS474]|uniref:hypothetical protein n=1 Tax=Verrucomicrobium sp. GAS474 TaxID=1882831 RepID=UPI00087CD8E9|nr:hypothetical protein [Verrucomicrobium sp. GAS474]SDU01705.1 hypothetical protein SAMN05444156_1466 [Verrucomicrobium sp. GAS474]